MVDDIHCHIEGQPQFLTVECDGHQQHAEQWRDKEKRYMEFSVSFVDQFIPEQR